jgi:hypothetical protein
MRKSDRLSKKIDATYYHHASSLISRLHCVVWCNLYISSTWILQIFKEIHILLISLLATKVKRHQEIRYLYVLLQQVVEPLKTWETKCSLPFAAAFRDKPSTVHRTDERCRLQAVTVFSNLGRPQDIRSLCNDYRHTGSINVDRNSSWANYVEAQYLPRASSPIQTCSPLPLHRGKTPSI